MTNTPNTPPPMDWLRFTVDSIAEVAAKANAARAKRSQERADAEADAPLTLTDVVGDLIGLHPTLAEVIDLIVALSPATQPAPKPGTEQPEDAKPVSTEPPPPTADPVAAYKIAPSFTIKFPGSVEDASRYPEQAIDAARIGDAIRDAFERYAEDVPRTARRAVRIHVVDRVRLIIQHRVEQAFQNGIDRGMERAAARGAATAAAEAAEAAPVSAERADSAAPRPDPVAPPEIRPITGEEREYVRLEVNRLTGHLDDTSAPPEVAEVARIACARLYTTDAMIPVMQVRADESFHAGYAAGADAAMAAMRAHLDGLADALPKVEGRE